MSSHQGAPLTEKQARILRRLAMKWCLLDSDALARRPGALAAYLIARTCACACGHAGWRGSDSLIRGAVGEAFSN